MVPTSKRGQLPDGAALAELAQAGAATARAHLAAAELLLDHDFWPQAAVLAILAFEEAGKAYIRAMAVVAPAELRADFPHAELDWNHQWKLAAAQAVRSMLQIMRGDQSVPESVDAVWAALSDLAREDNDTKKRAFYTDYLDGVVCRPADVTEEQARSLTAVVRDVVGHVAPLVELMTRLEAPPLVSAFFARATAAFHAGGSAPDEFAAAEMANVRSVAGMLAGYPAGMLANLLAAEAQDALPQPAPRD